MEDFWDFVVIPTSVIIFIFLLVSVVAGLTMNCHGSGRMTGYVTKVERIGDRVSITVKDSVESSNTYNGCISSYDEQIFNDIIGEEVALSWEPSFSLAPFWTECPGPVRLEQVITKGLK